MENSEPMRTFEVAVNNDDWSRRVEADESHRMSSSLVEDDDNCILHPPILPSSEGAVGVGDEDDDWSQQVETDEIQRMTSSIMMDDEADDIQIRDPTDALDVSVTPNAANIAEFHVTTSTELAPKREVPTLKEKLVERERQRRVETERARLKRQFALASNGGEGPDEDSSGILDGLARENGSVAGTIGEGSSVAQIDPYEDEGQNLTYPMERFLQEQITAIEEEPTRDTTREVQNQGVVMERFLQEPVVVDSRGLRTSERSNVDRSVSFDMEPTSTQESTTAEAISSFGEPVLGVFTPDSRPSYGENHDDFLDSSIDVGASMAGNVSVANASVVCLASENDARSQDLEESSESSELERETLRSETMGDHRLAATDSPSGDQPRVLGLTEAEIQELAAIEEASRSNAPPSDRDDLSASSFVGELVSDFGVQVVDPAATLSQGTPTTAMESASLVSGNQSAQRMYENAEDQQSIDEMGTASITSHIVVSSTGGSVSVRANPPSDIGADETPLLTLTDVIPSVSHLATTFNEPNSQSNPAGDHAGVAFEQSIPSGQEDSLELEASAAINEGVVNRKIRPGMFNVKSAAKVNDGESEDVQLSPMRRAVSVPDKMHFDLDGFDYDKNAPVSPASGLSGSVRELVANDMWSPGSKMSLSPFYPSMPRYLDDVGLRQRQDYGTANGGRNRLTESPSPVGSARAVCGDEREPLLPDIPHEIIATRETTREAGKVSGQNVHILSSLLDDVFSGIRSEGHFMADASRNAGMEYFEGSPLVRGYPDRLFALFGALFLEAPVLIMAYGGSDRLCSILGRSKTQLLMGFLPLSCALSGVVGLQSSYLTKCAISHAFVTPKTYKAWLIKEMGAAMFLGGWMGAVLGVMAFSLGGFSFRFGIIVMIAQFINITTAGLTGTLAPLVLTFVFKRVAGKWGGVLETAIQDVIGCFFMVVASFKILEIIGPIDHDPSDTCGASLLGL